MRVDIPDELIWIGIGYLANNCARELTNDKFWKHIQTKQKIEDRRPINIMGDLI